MSARERLDLSAATRDWDDLVAELQQLRGVARQPLLAAAASRATRRLGRRLLAELREHEAALRQPLAETEARLARLGTALADVDRSLRDLHYLFDATEADLSTIFARQRVEFVGRAQPEVARKLEQWVQDRLRTDGRRHLRDAALTEARRLAEAAVGGWLAEIEPAAEALYRQATARFAHLTHEFLARVAGDADRTPSDEVEPSAGFRLNRRSYFASLMHLTAAGPLTSIGHLAATSRRLEQRVAHAALIYLGQLLRVNSYRVEYDFKERTRESRRQMERHVRARLTEAVATAERALALASSTQRMNEAELGGRLEGLRRACEEVSGLAGAS